MNNHIILNLIICVVAVIFITVIGILIYNCICNYNKELNLDNKYADDKNYTIQEIPNFLTDEECDKIIELSNNKLVPSKIYTENEDLYSTDSRKSQQCWLEDDNDIIKNISERVKKQTNTVNNYQEILQVVNYPIGGFFTPHYDACDGDSTYCDRMNTKGGPRLWTILFYLNDNFEGGETVFPNINRVVKPKKGKAVIFKNINDNRIIIKQALHGGEPIKSGEKWIANKWIHIDN